MLRFLTGTSDIPGDVIAGFAELGIRRRNKAPVEVSAAEITAICQHLKTCALFILAKHELHADRSSFKLQQAIADHPKCDKTTALCIFWGNYPRHFMGTPPSSGADREQLALLQLINGRIARRHYPVLLASYRRLQEQAFVYKGRELSEFELRREVTTSMEYLDAVVAGDGSAWLSKTYSDCKRVQRLRAENEICNCPQSELRYEGPVWSASPLTNPFVEGPVPTALLNKFSCEYGLTSDGVERFLNLVA